MKAASTVQGCFTRQAITILDRWTAMMESLHFSGDAPASTIGSDGPSASAIDGGGAPPSVSAVDGNGAGPSVSPVDGIRPRPAPAPVATQSDPPPSSSAGGAPAPSASSGGGGRTNQPVTTVARDVRDFATAYARSANSLRSVMPMPTAMPHSAPMPRAPVYHPSDISGTHP